MANMTKKIFLTILFITLLITPARAEIKAVATLPWIGSIAGEIGGDKVSVTTLVKPWQDPHYIGAKPSMILAARRADIIMYNGLDLEAGYLPIIIESAKNPRIQPGRGGNLNCSAFVTAIEVNPSADRSQGDVHPLGNPHYHLSPANIGKVAAGIAGALSKLDVANAGFYSANLAAFNKKLETRKKNWEGKLKGKRFIAFHKYFEYLARDFGFAITGYIEPRPGIPPSTGHMASLIGSIGSGSLDGLLTTSFYGKKEMEFLSSRTGLKGIVAPHEVGCCKGADNWFTLMDRVVESLE